MNSTRPVRKTGNKRPGSKPQLVKKELPLVELIKAEPKLIAPTAEDSEVKSIPSNAEERKQALKEYMNEVLDRYRKKDPNYSKAQLSRTSGISINSLHRYFKAQFDTTEIQSASWEKLALIGGYRVSDLKRRLLGDRYNGEESTEEPKTQEQQEQYERKQRLARYVQEELKKRKRKNPDFVQRQLAEQYGLNTSTLSKYIRAESDPWTIETVQIRQLAKMRGWTEFELRAYFNEGMSDSPEEVMIQPDVIEEAWVSKAEQVSSDNLKRVGEIAASKLPLKQLSYLAQLYLQAVNSRWNNPGVHIPGESDEETMAHNQPLDDALEAKRIELEAEDPNVWRSLLKAFRITDEEMSRIHNGLYVKNETIPKLAKLLDLTSDEVTSLRDNHPDAPKYVPEDEDEDMGDGSRKEPKTNGSSK